MVLKFGILVLFLTIDGVFAKKRLLEVPKVNPGFILEQIPNLRRSLLRAHYAPVQGQLLSNIGRSLQSTEATCTWDAAQKDCSLSISSMRYLLEKSKTEFSNVINQGLECVEKTNKTDCNKEKACLWNEGMNECYYRDHRRNHEDSPCAKAAPLYFDYSEAIVLCGKQDSSERCERKKECQWSSENATCHPDVFFGFFGIDNFEDKVAQVISPAGNAVAQEYAVLLSSNDLTWESILDYKPSSVECLPDIESLVCEYVVALWSGILGPAFYCSGKYDSAAFACNADALCLWNTTSGECRSDESLTQPVATRSAQKVLTDSMSDGVDKSVMEALFTCGSVTEEGSCNGTCVWYPTSGSCAASVDHLATLLTEPAQNSTDGLCTYLAVDGASDCRSQFTKRKCQRRELCFWNAALECEPNNEFYFSAVAEGDRRLKKRYRRFKTRCSRRTSEKPCLA